MTRQEIIPNALLAAASVLFLLAANVLAPLPGYDTSAYKFAYWSVVVPVALALCCGWLALVGKARLGAIARSLTWPRPASAPQFILIVALTTAVLATVPHYFWIIRTTGAGKAPFSDLEMKCIQFLWSPVLKGMSRDASLWSIIAIIATSWFVFATAVASVWIVVRRKARISVIGTFLITSLVVELCLRLLTIVSPLIMPG